MNCSREDWHQLVPVLVKKSILQPIRNIDLLVIDGVPLLNGALAVPNKPVPAPGKAGETHLIMNMVPSR